MVKYFKIFERKVRLLFSKFRSDNNIKNYFYSKLRKELRKIIKELLIDPQFNLNYIESGIISLSKITHEYLYKILKKQNYIFIDNINKDIICKLLLLNDESRINQENHLINKKSVKGEIKDLNLRNINNGKNNINQNQIEKEKNRTQKINYSNQKEGFLMDNIIIEVENSKGNIKTDSNNDITITESLDLEEDKINFDLCSQQKLFNEEENNQCSKKHDNLSSNQDCKIEDLNTFKNETKQILDFFLEQHECEINNCFTYLSALEK